MELEGLEANLFSKVGSKEAKCGFSGREALPPLGAANVGVMAKTSLIRVGVIRAIILPGTGGRLNIALKGIY